MNPAIGTSEGQSVTLDPHKLIATRMLVQANSGGGKSWMLRVLCERLGPSIPLIVLDWEGEFASLREKLDVLLVGRDGEIPTAVATAGALATQILEIGVSAVIDLYDLNPSEKRTFVRKFLESLMAAPRRLWGPRLVIVDEAHNLCPEDGHYESSGPVCDLATAGRKRQYCAVLATQRLSKLSKDAAAELNNVLIGRCTLDVDQKRAGDLLGMAKAEYTKLRELEAGHFYGFGPAFDHRGVFLCRSGAVTTTHGSIGATAKPPAPSTRMQRAVEQLRDLAERSKTEVLDLDGARAKIRDLRARIASMERAKPVILPTDPASIDRAVSKAVADRDRWWTAEVSTIRGALLGADEKIRRIAAIAVPLNGEMPKAPVPPTHMAMAQAPGGTRTAVIPQEKHLVNLTDPFKGEKKYAPTAAQGLPKGERIVLTAIAQHTNGVDRTQLSILTGYKRSTRDAYLHRLRERGFITDGEVILLEQIGFDALGPDFEPLPTGDALREHWMRELPDGERKVFEILVRHFPGAVAREAISEATGYARSSRDAYLQRLSSRKLVMISRGEARASEELFK